MTLFLSLVGYYGDQFFYLNDTNVTFVSEKLGHRIISVLVNKDSTWVSTQDGTFLYLKDTIIDLKKNAPELGGQFHYVTSFNGKVWLSSVDETLFLEKDSFRRFEYDQLPSARIRFIPEDTNHMWAVSPSSTGIFLFTKRKDSNGITFTDVSTLPPLPTFIHRDLKVTNTGMYWYIEHEGVLVTPFKELKNNKYPYPSLQIRSVLVNSEKKDFKKENSLSLEYDENYIQVFYSGVNFSDRPVEYRFKLQDGNKDSDAWKDTKDDRLQFIGLNPGDYKLELQSRLTGLKWGESQFLQFKIKPPFWETWWFLLIVFTIILAIIYKITLYRINIANIEKTLLIGKLEAEQKALRAKMDPHFVSNIISAIQFFILKKENQKASKFLELFSNLMRNTLDQTDGEIITIEQEVTFLKEYIEMEKFRLMDKFDFFIEIDKSVNHRTKIPNFLIQPIVENAIEHGLKNSEHHGQLTIKFELEGNYLKIVISDNGVGLNRRIKSQSRNGYRSHGMKTVEERLNLYNSDSSHATFVLNDLSESNNTSTGTEVIMKVKVK